MIDAVQSPTIPKKQAAELLSPEQARAYIIARLEKAGAKGMLSPVTPRTPEPRRTILNQVLEELETAQEIFVDRRKTPKFYLWSQRPKIPTRENVAAALEAFAEREFPRLLAPADLKDALGKDKETQALIFRAFEQLAAERRLLVLRYEPSKKKKVELYVHLESLRRVLKPAPVVPIGPDPTVAVELTPMDLTSASAEPLPENSLAAV